MNIGPYTFTEFKQMAAAFHSYPAPGLLLGGYMVEMAKRHIPEGTLFEAIVESGKCLPDAVQLLTLCSTGNQWMKVTPLGRYAVTLYDKFTGAGVRVWVNVEKLKKYPEYYSWFMKLKPKKEQDSPQLFSELEEAGDTVCDWRAVQVFDHARKHDEMGGIAVCPLCHEAYPAKDGGICRGCQGEAPCMSETPLSATDASATAPASVSSATAKSDAARILEQAPLRVHSVEEIAKEAEEGKEFTILHDMTEIVPGETKAPAFLKGQNISVGDVCRLQRIGKFHAYSDEDLCKDDWVHENDAVKAFAPRMAGEGIVFGEPREGKITFRAEKSGMLSINLDVLERFNLCPNVMLATRHGYALVKENESVGASRAIPLYLSQSDFSRAVTALGDEPLLRVLPMRKAKVGVLVTGTEVFNGIIKDQFLPIVTEKIDKLGASVIASAIAPDDRDIIANHIKDFLDKGADLIITTAGMSVDPDDLTRAGLVDAGLYNPHYGIPVLPGAMTLVGRLRYNGHDAQIIGVPACAVFKKTTTLDLVLPPMLTGHDLTHRELARFAEGGYCQNCPECTYPHCPFGK